MTETNTNLMTCDQCHDHYDWLLCSRSCSSQLCMACWIAETNPTCYECGAQLGDQAVIDIGGGVLLCWDDRCGAECATCGDEICDQAREAAQAYGDPNGDPACLRCLRGAFSHADLTADEIDRNYAYAIGLGMEV